MSTPTLHSPRLPGCFVVAREAGTTTISFWYDPATLRRELSQQFLDGGSERRDAQVPVYAAPSETISLTAVIDGTLAPEAEETVAETAGIYPQLAALLLEPPPPLRQVPARRRCLNL